MWTVDFREREISYLCSRLAASALESKDPPAVAGFDLVCQFSNFQWKRVEMANSLKKLKAEPNF